MKKFYLLLTLIVITAIQVANAQAPQGIPYQAVARDNAGNLIKNQPISLRFSIHDGSASGAVVYSETHAVTTDALGLFNVNIGGGTSSATLADVNWGSGAKFTQVELDVTGGSNYVNMGTTQMMSVPYALYAGSSAAAPSVFQTTAADPNNISNVNSGNVGIGTDAPTEKLDVAGNVKVRGTIIAGEYATATGNSAFSMGRGTTASGDNSTAMGYNTVASGVYSTAMGLYSNASGQGSVSMGANNVASGLTSLAFGSDNTASGFFSTAMGIYSNASGNQSVAIGTGITAKSNAEIAVGIYNTVYQPGSTEGYVASDRLFVIGNGTDANNKSDAMVVLKNGNTTIKGTTTANSFVKDGGTSSQFLMADGTTSVGPDLTGYATTDALNNTASMLSTNLDAEIVRAQTAEVDLSNQISNIQSNFVTTSSDSNNISNVNSGNVGIGTDLPSEKLDVAGNLKVRGNISNGGSNASGLYSIATGQNSTASGPYSTAMGDASIANGYSTTALGIASTASGWGSTAIGILSSTEGSASVALGNRAKAYSLSEIAVGQFNTAYALNTPTSTYEFNGADRIFVVGNGQDDNNLSDAMVVLKNGNTTINGTTTANSFVKAGGTSSQYLMADGSTTTGGGTATTMGSIGASSTYNGGTINSGVLSLAPADGTNGGIVTSSAQTFGGKKTFADSAVAKGFRATDSLTTKGFRATGTATANSFVKEGGTSSQYLMADGSVTNTAAVYTIGLWPELGGYVFRISADGKHGLVAETFDQAYFVPWYLAQDFISNSSNHTPAGAKFMDWRLPTKYELMELYTQREAIGRFTIDQGYWCSTELNYADAWGFRFFTSNPYYFTNSKSSSYFVRSVRAF